MGGIIMNDLTDNEFPSPRADVELVREKTGIRLEGSAGPLTVAGPKKHGPRAAEGGTRPS
jgi:hypothetical protein